MRIELQFLKNLDRGLAGYGALLLVAVVAAGGTTWHLGTLGAGLEESRQELTQKQADAERVVLPTTDEEREWNNIQNVLASRLLGENELAVFQQQIINLATQNRLNERLNVGTEEIALAEGEEAGPLSDQLARSIGIRRYTQLTLNFSGAYQDTARFIQEIGRLPRLTEFTSMELSRNPPTMNVNLVLRVYMREEAL